MQDRALAVSFAILLVAVALSFLTGSVWVPVEKKRPTFFPFAFVG
jgi:hypothetical protein